ncbi:MAG: hypothetical protein JJE39_06845 [Vicinamibacteria bacterium]|nr:hypothetical protein [Vicinamibacteria bacterium]
MEKAIRNIIVAAAATALALTGGTSRAADRQAPTVVVHVADLAGVGSAGLARAMAQTMGVYKAAGVRLVWVEAGKGPGARACEGLNVFVTLLSPRQLLEQGGRESALGRAARAERQAWIYPGRVSLLAWQKSMDERVLLGLVIAHEVGHLLLPGPGHSSDGIMTAGIDTDPRGVRARFTPREVQGIRARVESEAGNPEERTTCGS